MGKHDLAKSVPTSHKREGLEGSMKASTWFEVYPRIPSASKDTYQKSLRLSGTGVTMNLTSASGLLADCVSSLLL